MDHSIKGYKKKTGTYVAKNRRALGKLQREVEKAKRTLSSQQSVRIEIESFEDGNDFSETLTRAKFEEINTDLFRQTLPKPVQQVLQDANVNKGDVDEVVLVGSILAGDKGTNDMVFIDVNPLTLGIVPVGLHEVDPS